MTPEQIKVKIQEARNQGVPDSVTFDYLNKRGLIPKDKIIQSNPIAVQQPQEVDTYGALFPAVKGENPAIAGLKAVGNLPTSAYGLGKGILQAGLNIFNPDMEKNTIANIAKVGAGGIQKLIPGQQEQEDKFDAFTKVLKDRYGSLDNLTQTATNDPFGFGSDILSVITGGAGLVGKSGQVAKAISTTGQLVTKPATNIAGKIGSGVSSTAKFATSQATGLNPETISQLLKKPEAFKNVSSRSDITDAVKNSLDTRLQELGGLGKEYQVLRDTPQIVTIPKNTIRNVLNKYGVKLDDNNQILTSAESRPLSLGDRNAIQEFVNNYGKERVLSSNAFLNTREALSNLSKYDASKTNISTSIARDLRATYDDLGKAQVKGLKELDAQYAPERQLLGQLKKDIFTPQGDLKDGAINKIANITGTGKEKLLARMKEIVPDIEQRVRVIRAVEDIEKASGFKTGTYIRGAITGGGILTGNVPAIIGAILAQPEIAVPILKGAGYVGQKARPILDALRTISNDVNNFKLPAPILNQIEKSSSNFKAGLSVDNITKNITPAEKAILRDFTDLTNGAIKSSDAKYVSNIKRRAQEVADKYKFSASTKGDKALSNQIGEYLDSVGFDRKLNSTKKSPTFKQDPTTGKMAGSISKESQPLIQEAKKYKSAEEFVKNNDLVFQGGEKGTKSEWWTTDMDTARNFANRYGELKDGEIRVAKFSDIPGEFRVAAEDWTNTPLSKQDYLKSQYGGKGQNKIITVPIEKAPKFESISSKSQLTDIWNKANKK